MGDFYPTPAPGTVRCWCGTRTARETSPHRSCPRVSAGSASALQSRLRGLRGGLEHGEPAPGPGRPAVPGGDHVRGAPALCGGDAVGLSRVVWRFVRLETWGTPDFCLRSLAVAVCPSTRAICPLASVSIMSPRRH